MFATVMSADMDGLLKARSICQHDVQAESAEVRHGMVEYVAFGPDLMLSEDEARALRSAVQIISEHVALRLDRELLESL